MAKKKKKSDAARLREEANKHDEDCVIGYALGVVADTLDGADTGENFEDGCANSSSGPAQVATKQYRNNWDTIFGNRQVVGQA